MFELTEDEKYMLVDKAGQIFNTNERRIILKLLMMRIDDFKEACIKVGYDNNARIIPDDVCKAIMQIIIKC